MRRTKIVCTIGPATSSVVRKRATLGALEAQLLNRSERPWHYL
jgi:pyruvate kinase